MPKEAEKPNSEPARRMVPEGPRTRLPDTRTAKAVAAILAASIPSTSFPRPNEATFINSGNRNSNGETMVQAQAPQGIRAAAEDLSRLSSDSSVFAVVRSGNQNLLLQRANDLMAALDGTGQLYRREVMLGGVRDQREWADKYSSLTEEQKLALRDQAILMMAQNFGEQFSAGQAVRINEAFGGVVQGNLESMFAQATAAPAETAMAPGSRPWLESIPIVGSLFRRRGAEEVVPTPVQQPEPETIEVGEAALAAAVREAQEFADAVEMHGLSSMYDEEINNLGTDEKAAVLVTVAFHDSAMQCLQGIGPQDVDSAQGRIYELTRVAAERIAQQVYGEAGRSPPAISDDLIDSWLGVGLGLIGSMTANAAARMNQTDGIFAEKFMNEAHSRLREAIRTNTEFRRAVLGEAVPENASDRVRRLAEEYWARPETVPAAPSRTSDEAKAKRIFETARANLETRATEIVQRGTTLVWEQMRTGGTASAIEFFERLRLNSAASGGIEIAPRAATGTLLSRLQINEAVKAAAADAQVETIVTGGRSVAEPALMRFQRALASGPGGSMATLNFESGRVSLDLQLHRYTFGQGFSGTWGRIASEMGGTRLTRLFRPLARYNATRTEGREAAERARARGTGPLQEAEMYRTPSARFGSRTARVANYGTAVGSTAVLATIGYFIITNLYEWASSDSSPQQTGSGTAPYSTGRGVRTEAAPALTEAQQRLETANGVLSLAQQIISRHPHISPQIAMYLRWRLGTAYNPELGRISPSELEFVNEDGLNFAKQWLDGLNRTMGQRAPGTIETQLLFYSEFFRTWGQDEENAMSQAEKRVISPLETLFSGQTLLNVYQTLYFSFTNKIIRGESHSTQMMLDTLFENPAHLYAFNAAFEEKYPRVADFIRANATTVLERMPMYQLAMEAISDQEADERNNEGRILSQTLMKIAEKEPLGSPLWTQCMYNIVENPAFLRANSDFIRAQYDRALNEANESDFGNYQFWLFFYLPEDRQRELWGASNATIRTTVLNTQVEGHPQIQERIDAWKENMGNQMFIAEKEPLGSPLWTQCMYNIVENPEFLRANSAFIRAQYDRALGTGPDRANYQFWLFFYLPEDRQRELWGASNATIRTTVWNTQVEGRPPIQERIDAWKEEHSNLMRTTRRGEPEPRDWPAPRRGGGGRS